MSEKHIAIIGAGPAGLEATRALGRRGYTVMLAEASRAPGGRVSRECELPGLGSHRRVRNNYLARSSNIATAGSVLPSRNSRKAPPAVEI